MAARNTLKIAILFNPQKPDTYGVWDYDISRYCYQLIGLLNKLKHQVTLITPDTNDSLETLGDAKFGHFGIDNYLKNAQKLDFIIEFPSSIRHHLLKTLKEKSTAKLIAARYGNVQFEDIAGLFIRKHLDTDIHHQMADHVWLIGDCPDNLAYLEHLYHMPIEVAPLLWEPEKEITPLQPRPNGIANILVCEKNNSVVSNLLGAAVIVNGIAVADENAFGIAFFNNSAHICNNRYFLTNSVRSLEYLGSSKEKAWFINDTPIEEIFQHQDVVIGYQHCNSINLYYLEAIARNIPLVHNNPLLIDIGYFYPEFDFKTGIERAMRALKYYNADEWQTRNTQFVDRFSISEKNNIKRYQELLKK